MLWDRPHGHYWISHCSWDRVIQPAKESHFQDRFCCISFCYLCCTNLDAPPTSNQNAKNNFAFSLLLSAHSSLQQNDCSTPGTSPFLVPPSQPRHGEGPPGFSELGSQLWFLFPSMSNPWTSPGASNPDVPSNTSPAHGPGQGGPPASQPRLLSHPPQMVSVLPASTLLSLCSFHLLSTSLLSLQHLSQYFTPPYSPLFKNPTKVHKYLFWLCV